MADCMANRKIRAISEYENNELPLSESIALNQLGDGAVLAITISPDDGERYQSIVPIEHESLEKCLQDYFQRSEQLPSLFKLLGNEKTACGISIHALPQEKVKDKAIAEQHFERLEYLLNSLKVDEALSLENDRILTRLFHEESCRLFGKQTVEFGCICSAQKSLDALKSLGTSDLQNLINEQKQQGEEALVVDCHFCFQRYEFNFDQVQGLLQ